MPRRPKPAGFVEWHLASEVVFFDGRQRGVGIGAANHAELEWIGVASGARGLNSSLVAPLNDTIKPLVFGFQEITMSELAERTLQVYKNIAL